MIQVREDRAPVWCGEMVRCWKCLKGALQETRLAQPPRPRVSVSLLLCALSALLAGALSLCPSPFGLRWAMGLSVCQPSLKLLVAELCLGTWGPGAGLWPCPLGWLCCCQWSVWEGRGPRHGSDVNTEVWVTRAPEAEC